jgi:hypothetical protein
MNHLNCNANNMLLDSDKNRNIILSDWNKSLWGGNSKYKFLENSNSNFLDTNNDRNNNSDKMIINNSDNNNDDININDSNNYDDNNNDNNNQIKSMNNTNVAGDHDMSTIKSYEKNYENNGTSVLVTMDESGQPLDKRGTYVYLCCCVHM